MSNQICRGGDSLWFLLDSYALLLYQNVLLIIPRQYYIILWLQSNACLELARIHYLADTRLSRLPIGEPGNEAATLTCAA